MSKEHIESEEEKEFKRRLLNGTDAGKKLAEGIELMTKKLKEDITPQLQSIANEAYITQRPEAKKEMVINGKKCIVSLISDGRVMIDFGAFDDAKNMYEEMRFEEREKSLNDLKSFYYNQGMKLSKDNQYLQDKNFEYITFISLPLYKRIFKKRPV